MATLAEARASQSQRQADLLAWLVGGAWGLSLGNHPTALFCGPLVLLTLWRLRLFRLGAVGIALGLIVHLYLPLRAAASPPINWGNPRTLEQFWWMISGGPYRQFLFSLPLGHLPVRLLAWTSLLTRQFTGFGLIVAALGALVLDDRPLVLWPRDKGYRAAALWTANRPLLKATGATVTLCSVFAVGYNTSDSYLYLIPALVCLGLWLGTGINWLVSVLAMRARRAAWAAAVLLLPQQAGASTCRFEAQLR